MNHLVVRAKAHVRLLEHLETLHVRRFGVWPKSEEHLAEARTLTRTLHDARRRANRARIFAEVE